jgi:hypothetical protein
VSHRDFHQCSVGTSLLLHVLKPLAGSARRFLGRIALELTLDSRTNRCYCFYSLYCLPIGRRLFSTTSSSDGQIIGATVFSFVVSRAPVPAFAFLPDYPRDFLVWFTGMCHMAGASLKGGAVLKRMQVTDRLGIPSHWCQTCQESLAKRLWRGTRFWWVVVEVCTLMGKEERVGSNSSVDRLEGRELDLTRDDGKRRRSSSLATLEMNKEKKFATKTQSGAMKKKQL